MDVIVQEMEPVLLIGGADCSDHEISCALGYAHCIVAADSGAKRALDFGVTPKAVIGDLDSIGAKEREILPEDCFHLIEEQNSTDFDKALRSIDAPLVIGVGFSGGRVDHQLAVYNSLVRQSMRRCVLLGAQNLVFLAPPTMVLDLPVGTIVSLFPMGDVSGTSQGLRWAIDGIEFAPDGRIGPSNEATGPMTLKFGDPKMLVILPVDALAAVISMFAHSPCKWPVL